MYPNRDPELPTKINNRFEIGKEGGSKEILIVFIFRVENGMRVWLQIDLIHLCGESKYTLFQCIKGDPVCFHYENRPTYPNLILFFFRKNIFMVNDTISDMLTRIRNSCLIKNQIVRIFFVFVVVVMVKIFLNLF